MEHVTDGAPEVSPAYMEPTEFFDFDVKEVRNFAFAALQDADTVKDKAIRLFYAVRDSIRYDPYTISMDPSLYKASSVLAAGSGFCLPKANLLIACARAAGIPAGIGLADVKNHLCTERLRRMMGGKEIFLHHGFAVLHIDGKWVKAAPAFNIELCDKFDVTPTEFDGVEDALLQEFDKKGHKHMEYVATHGIWSDLPFERVYEDFTEYYGAELWERCRAAVAQNERKQSANFEDEKPVT